MRRVRRIPLARPTPGKRVRSALATHRWAAITLTWRRAARLAQLHVARPGRAVVHNNWSPCFNLHVYFAFAAQSRRSRPGAPSAFASLMKRRHSYLHVTSLQTLAGPLLSNEMRRSVQRTSREVSTHERTIATATFTEIRRLFRTGCVPIRAARPLASRAASFSRRGADARKICGTPYLMHRTHSEIFERRAVSMIIRNRAELPLEKPVSRFAAPPPRGQQLVWRMDSQAAMIDAIERGIGTEIASAAPLVAASATQLTQSPAPPEFSPARMLDPALIDRVAEDVIGRVERRIRIERERRGA